MLFYYHNGSEIGAALINTTMNQSILSTNRARYETAEWLEENVQPNVFAVATLKQSIVSSYGGYAGRISGTSDIYSAAYRQSLCRFTEQVVGCPSSDNLRLLAV